MVEVFALEINFGAAKMGRQAFGEIKRAFAPHIMGEQPRQFRLEGGILFRGLIGLFQRQHQRHQGLGDEASAIGAKMAMTVGTRAPRIGNPVHAVCLLIVAAWMKSRMACASFTPGALSTPEETSTSFAPDKAMARATLSGIKATARTQGLV